MQRGHALEEDAAADGITAGAVSLDSFGAALDLGIPDGAAAQIGQCAALLDEHGAAGAKSAAAIAKI